MRTGSWVAVTPWGCVADACCNGFESFNDADGKIGFAISIQLFIPSIVCPGPVDIAADGGVDIFGDPDVFPRAADLQHPSHPCLFQHPGLNPHALDEVKILKQMGQMIGLAKMPEPGCA
jgi:hypothetical protein